MREELKRGEEVTAENLDELIKVGNEVVQEMTTGWYHPALLLDIKNKKVKVIKL